MAVIDQLQAHFSAQSVRQIEVPEWGEGDQPLVIFAKPLTLSDKQKLRRIGQTEGEMDVLIHTLIMKAEDGQGNKLFTVADKHALMNRTDPDVLARVVMQITRPRSIEELETK